MNRNHSAPTHEEIERYRVAARAMQSREMARLAKRLSGAPARLLARLRAGRADVSDARCGGRAEGAPS